jgi:hypothetical protein
MAWAEQVFSCLLVESYWASHVRADLGEGDDAFMGPRHSLLGEFQLCRTESNEDGGIFCDIRELAMLGISDLGKDVRDCADLEVFWT